MLKTLFGACWALTVSIATVTGLPAAAETAPAAEPTRLIQIGSGFGAADSAIQGASVLSMPKMPTAAEAKIAFLSTILRSNTVSTFIGGPQDLGGNTDQLFVSVRGEVSPGPVAQPSDGTAATPGSTGLALTLDGEALPMAEVGARMTAMVEAVAPRSRRIAFFQLSDPNGVFAAYVADFQQAVSASGFEMVVAEIGTRPEACKLGVSPELAMIAGLADRVPFGNGDGTTTAAEAAKWLNDALARPGKRMAECNTTYAIVVRSNQDAETAVATSIVGAVSQDLDSQLYRETFEAKFLLGSSDVSKVSSFLESCVHCPNERDLTAKLQDLRQKEVTRGLEASIWEDIRNDTTSERLEIYLANCALCENRADVEEMIAKIKAKELARETEKSSFTAASSTGDLAALRQYRDGCIACDFKTEAESLIATIEADEAYRGENAALDAGMQLRDRAALETWIKSCVTCDRKAEAEAMVAELVQAETLIGPVCWPQVFRNKAARANWPRSISPLRAKPVVPPFRRCRRTCRCRSSRPASIRPKAHMTRPSRPMTLASQQACPRRMGLPLICGLPPLTVRPPIWSRPRHWPPPGHNWATGFRKKS